MSLMECVNHMYRMQKEAKDTELPMLYLLFSKKDYKYKGTAVYTTSQAAYCSKKGYIVLKHTYFDGMNLSTDNSLILEERCKEVLATGEKDDAYELCPNS